MTPAEREKADFQTIELHVTEQHIAHGKKAMCDACPIALALQERLKSNHITVGSTTVEYVTRDASTYRVILPESAQTFIELFDGGNKVESRFFQIDVPRVLLEVADGNSI